MGMSDTIADMFTRIRNAVQAKHDELRLPFSKEKQDIAKILKDEGFIESFDVISEDNNKKSIKIVTKYDDDGVSLISKIERVSKPGKRIYVAKADIPKVQNGFGISIVSTSKGILTGRAARLANVGGEFIGKVY